jgi:hypothetical protein
MNRQVSRAHAGTLAEWGDLYERDGAEGSTEVAFLLRRAARLLGKMGDFDTGLPPEPPTPEPPQDEPALDHQSDNSD